MYTSTHTYTVKNKVRNWYGPSMVVYACNPSPLQAEQGGLCAFKASLVYRVGSSPARPHSRTPPLKKKRRGGAFLS